MVSQVNIKIPYKHQKCPILSKGFFFLSKEKDCKYLYLTFFFIAVRDKFDDYVSSVFIQVTSKSVEQD